MSTEQQSSPESTIENENTSEQSTIESTLESQSTASDSRKRASVQLKGKAFDEQLDALRPDTHPGFDLQAAMLSPNATVQMKGTGIQKKDIHDLAAQGTQGSGGSLPHLDTIQNSFGRHDVSGVQAHTDSAAQSASQAMGAQAYASGNSVAFGGSPSLHTAAHEAAHIVQQRGGVSLDGGVGKAGDSYENHADAVADAVVSGQSAEGLLDSMAGGGKSSAIQKQEADAPVQLKNGNALPDIQLSPGAGSSEDQQVRELIAQGTTSENSLTNEIFYARHPDLRGTDLRAGSAEAREWIQIRNDVVRPILSAPPEATPEEPSAEEGSPEGAVAATVAADVFESVDGFGTDEDRLFAALAQIEGNPTLIAQVQSAYRAAYGRDILTDLRGDLSGEDLARAMAVFSSQPTEQAEPEAPSADQLAREIHGSIAGFGTDEDRLFTALDQMAGNSALISQTSSAYRSAYGTDMATDIAGDLSGEDLARAEAILPLANVPMPGGEADAEVAPVESTEEAVGQYFVVTDGNALIRTAPPTFSSTGEKIPLNTQVVVIESATNSRGSQYSKVQDLNPGESGEAKLWGWTSHGNLMDGKYLTRSEELSSCEGGSNDRESLDISRDTGNAFTPNTVKREFNGLEGQAFDDAVHAENMTRNWNEDQNALIQAAREFASSPKPLSAQQQANATMTWRNLSMDGITLNAELKSRLERFQQFIAWADLVTGPTSRASAMRSPKVAHSLSTAWMYSRSNDTSRSGLHRSGNRQQLATNLIDQNGTDNDGNTWASASTVAALREANGNDAQIRELLPTMRADAAAVRTQNAQAAEGYTNRDDRKPNVLPGTSVSNHLKGLAVDMFPHWIFPNLFDPVIDAIALYFGVFRRCKDLTTPEHWHYELLGTPLTPEIEVENDG